MVRWGYMANPNQQPKPKLWQRILSPFAALIAKLTGVDKMTYPREGLSSAMRKAPH